MKFNKKNLSIIFLILISIIFTQTRYIFASNYNSDQEQINNLKDQLEEANKEIESLKEEEKIKKLVLEYKPNFPTLFQDSSSTITLDIKNLGETNLKFTEVKISSLPAGVSLKNNATPQLNIGDFNVGDTISCKYELDINKKTDVGNFPISFDIKAKYGPNNYKEYTTSKSFYLTVNKTDQGSNLKPIVITNINHPSIIKKGETVNFNFTVKNPNSAPISSIKISVLPEEGLVNQSQSVFVVNDFAAGSTRDFSVKLFPKDGAERKNYSININCEDISEKTDDDTLKIPTSSQYSGIFYDAAKKEDGDGVKNPHILITNYTYGGKTVTPGEEFYLNMDFLNTSKSKTLRNIKISISSEESIFIPLNSSNSFFIDSLSPSGTYSKNITFTTKADAPTKTVPVDIDYTYEDTEGNPLQTKETISIPVVQKTDFSIDDVMKPYDGMEGDPVPISVSFYNLGKTTISNLMITSSGSFTVEGDPTYFVGTMEAGKSDSYSINAFPEDPHHINGTISFTYEKVDGETETVEKTFDFELNPMPYEDPSIMDNLPDENQGRKSPIFVIGGIVIAFVVLLLVIRHHKKKKESEFDLDE